MAFNFTPFPVLSTERLLLRELNLNDAPQIFELRSDDVVNKYLDRPKAKSIKDAEDFINKINFGIRENQCLYWAICLKDQSKLCGTICLWNFSDQKDKAETGYELLPVFQGKGIIQEALISVIDYSFNTLQLKTIEAWTTAPNFRSINVLERNHFQRDFDAERMINKESDGTDSVIYSLHRTKAD